MHVYVMLLCHFCVFFADGPRIKKFIHAYGTRKGNNHRCYASAERARFRFRFRRYLKSVKTRKYQVRL